MAYGNTGRPVRAYRFGALRPREGWPEALAQHRLRTLYWNELVRIDQERRAAVEEAVAAAAAPAETDEARRAARAAAWREPAVRETADALRRAAYERQKEVRHGLVEQGLYWPNYLDVEASFQLAARGKEPPRFHRFDPLDGRIAFPFTNGAPARTILDGSDTRVRLEPIPPWSAAANAARHAARTRLLRVRVGTSPDRQPIWFALPVILHRPLPADGVVRGVGVNWRRRGAGVVYSVTLVVEQPGALPEPGDGPAVALDLCWRRLEDGGLRCGYWRGEDGASGEVRLPASWLAAMERVEALRSLRDQHLNALRPALLAWIDGAPGVPDWLREARRWMSQWRSARRFAGLAIRWRHQRFAGDDAGLALIEAWRKRDKHLAEWEANLRDNLLDQRREIYRLAAVALSRRYARLVLEDFDLRRVTTRAGAADLPAAARHQRFMAAPSELRLALVNAFARDHGAAAVVSVPAAYTTLACHVCGQIDPTWDPAAALVTTCPHCGATHDQDARACYHLLERADRARAAGAGRSAQ
jgi:hypothetical protein